MNKLKELQIFTGEVVEEIIKRLQTRELSSRFPATIDHGSSFMVHKVYHFEDDKGKKAAVDVIKDVVSDVLNDMQVEAKLADYKKAPQRSAA